MSVRAADFPSIDALGRDLLAVHPWRLTVSLGTPFLLALGFLVFADHRLWMSVSCTILVTFFTLEHLYHLEHHLYPLVPHHNWPELAHRLDPYFSRVGLRPLRLFF